jgi:hypothetical protein
MSDFYLNDFLGMDLKWGVFIYGAVMVILSSVLAFDFDMKWHFYLYWGVGITPYGTAVTSLVINMYTKQNGGMDKAFQRGQWYLCFLLYMLAIVFTVVQTAYLSVGVSKLWPDAIAAQQAQAGMISGLVDQGTVAGAMPAGATIVSQDWPTTTVGVDEELFPGGGSDFSDQVGMVNDFSAGEVIVPTPTSEQIFPESDGIPSASDFFDFDLGQIFLATPDWFTRLWHEPHLEGEGAKGASISDPYQNERIWLGITILLIWLLLGVQGYFTLVSWSYYRRWYRSGTVTY